MITSASGQASAQPRSMRMKDQSWTVMLPPSKATGSQLAAVDNNSLPLVSKRLEPTCVQF